MIRKIKMAALAMSLFFAILAPYLKFGVYSINSAYFFLYIPALFYIYESLLSKKRIPLEYVTLLFLIFVTLVYTVINQLVYGLKDFIVLRYCISGLIIGFAVLFYRDRLKAIYGDDDKNAFLGIFINVICINALLSLISIVSPEFKKLLYSIVDVNELVFEYRITTRLSGVVYTGFGFLSTLYAFAIVICFVLYQHKVKKIDRVVLFAKVLLIFADMLFVGRTGIIVVALGVVMLYALPAHSKDRSAYSHLLCGIPLVIGGAFFVIARMVDLSKYQKEISWIFSVFIELLAGESIAKNSSVAALLSEHIKAPEGVLQLLFGNGDYNVGVVKSDIGYIQILFGGGILGIILMFSLFIAGIATSLKHKSDDDFWKILLILSVALLVVNLKDLYYISYCGYSFLFFIIYLFALDYKKKRAIGGIIPAVTV